MTQTLAPKSTNDPRVEPTAKEVKTLTDTAQDIAVTDAASYERGAEILRAIKSMHCAVENSRKKITVPLDKAKTETMNLFRPMTDQLTITERVIKRRMLAWKDEQDRIAREEQRKADEKARKERDWLEQAAAKAEQDGRTSRAEILRDRAAATVPAIPPPVTPKVSGIFDRKVMQFEIFDPKQIPREFLMPDEKRIRRYVNAMRTDADIPGVRIWEESSLAARKT